MRKHTYPLSRLFTLVSLLALATISRPALAQLSLGVTAGAQVSSQTIRAEGIGLSPESLISPFVGLTAQLPLSDRLAFQPQLSYSQKGYKMNMLGMKTTQRLHYLEIPLQAVYYLPVGAGQLFVGAGLSVGIGLSARMKVDASQLGSGLGLDPGDMDLPSGTITIPFSNSEDGIKRLDLGARLSAGYQFAERFALTASYAPSFTNLDNSREAKIRNQAFNVTGTFFFW